MLDVRQRARSLIASGWGRLFLVVWGTAVVAFSYRYYQYKTWEPLLYSNLSSQSALYFKVNLSRETRDELIRGWEQSEQEIRREMEQYGDAPTNLQIAVAGPPLLAGLALWVARGFKRKPGADPDLSS